MSDAPMATSDCRDAFFRVLRGGLVVGSTRWRVRRAWPADLKDATQGYVLELADPDGRVAGARLKQGRTDFVPDDPTLPALADQRADGWCVLAHRAGKRAVLRRGDTGPFRKLATPKATRRAARRAATVDVLLAGAPVPLPPARKKVDADRGILDLAPADGTALRALLTDPANRSATIEAAGRGLGGVLVALAQIDPESRCQTAAELPSHTLLDEATVLRRWVSSAVALAPIDPAARHRLSEEARTVADALAGQHPPRRPHAASAGAGGMRSPGHAARSRADGMTSPRAGSDAIDAADTETTGTTGAPIVGAVLAHRDLHDGQVLVTADGSLTILDWDTAAWADPCLDPANLVAHLDLLVTQQPASSRRVDRFLETFLGALGDGSHPAAGHPERLELLVRSASVRIRAVHAFRGAPAYAPDTAEAQRRALF